MLCQPILNKNSCRLCRSFVEWEERRIVPTAVFLVRMALQDS